jgi:hypothetical protein
MERYQVTSNTILDHLTRYLLAGNKLRHGHHLRSLISAPPDVQQAAFNAFDELSPAFLSPVFNKLNGTVKYEDLKVLRMLYMISRQE